MIIDLGDAIKLSVATYDASGTVSAVCTIYNADGTTSTPTVSNEGEGIFSVNFTPSTFGRYAVRWTITNATAVDYDDEIIVRDFFAFQPVTLDDARKFLNKKKTDDDAELADFIDAAVEICEEICGRVLGRRTISEFHDGGSDCLYFMKPDCISISSVVEDGVTLDPSNYIVDKFGHSLIRTDGKVFKPGASKVRITYVAGFNSVPAGVRHAIKLQLQHMWETQRGATNVNVFAKTNDEYDSRVTYTTPRRVLQALNPWRYVRVG